MIDSNTETKSSMIEDNTEPNPIGHDGNTLKSNHKFSQSQNECMLGLKAITAPVEDLLGLKMIIKSKPIAKEVNDRTKACWAWRQS